MADPAARLVLTSVADPEAAETLARAIVDARAAACVSILPIEASVYRWKGETCAEPERLLLIKTTEDRLSALRELLATAHPYELPELLILEARASAPYLGWLVAETRPAA